MTMSPIFEAASLARIADVWQLTTIAVLLKGTILLCAAGLAAVALRRSSAATRHMVWSAGVLALLILPILSVSLPALEVKLPRWGTTEPQATEQPATTTPKELRLLAQISTPEQNSSSLGPFIGELHHPDDASPATMVFEPDSQAAATPGLVHELRTTLADLSPSTWAFLGWELGALLVLGYFAFGRLRLGWLERDCIERRVGPWPEMVARLAAEIGLERRVRVLQSNRALTPMTWGILKPVLLLPRDADDWSDEQRRDVVLHELHHIRRHDCLSQSFAQLACILYWFHPLVWFSARQMRDERERACDDEVLMAGSKASSYASHLLEMARSLRAEQHTAFASVAIARRSQLSDRLIAVLDPQLARSAPRRGRTLALSSAAGVLLLSLAVLKPVTAAPPDHILEQRVSPIVVAPTPPSVSAPRTYSFAGRAVPLAPVPGARRVFAVSPRVAPTPGYALVAADSPVAVVADDGSYNWSHSSEDDDSSLHIQSDDGQMRWVYKDDDLRLWIEADGEIELSDDDSDIASISDDGYFEIGRGRGRNAKSVQIEPDDDGSLIRTYYEGRKAQDWDATAEEFLADVLADAIQFTGIGADVRAERLYRDGGIDRVFEEIDEMPSEHVRKKYFMALMAIDDLSDGDRRRVLMEITRTVDSDYELATFLLESLDEFMADEEMRNAYFDAVQRLDSDYETSRVLRGAFERNREFTPEQLAAVLTASQRIDSDYERSQVLREVRARELADEALRDAYFQSVDAFDSDYERSQVLQALLDEAEDDPALAGRILEAVLAVDSDYERAQVLVGTAHTYLRYPELHELYFDAVEEIHSSYERSRVLMELMETADLSVENQIRLIRLAGAIDSDFEKAKVLSQIASLDIEDDEVFEALGEEIDQIANDHEYGKAMKALRRAERRRDS